MKKTAAGIILALSVLFFVPEAQAEFFYFGLQGGISKQKAGFSDIKFNADTSFLYGVKAGLNFMMFSAELNYLQAAHNLDPADTSVPVWLDRKLDYSYLGVNLRWIFPILFVHPYATAGYGSYTADIHDIAKDHNGGFNLGAGVELMLGKRVSFFAEGKYHHVNLDINAKSFKVSDLALTGGIHIFF